MTEDCIWIDTKDKLLNLAEVLSRECEFAVDTEQHSVRSFLGFTALLQVSTRKQDFLIDAIALHDEMGILRDVFADPGICKVFHGADSDSLWLQRDFHIYIVNLFDTSRACDILGKPQRSLAYLLQSYCGIVANKIFQRADWRLRPLPEEMIEYARTDAHYLLYIADCLQNELFQGRSGDSTCQYSNNGDLAVTGSLYEECVRRSNMICLQLYEKDDASPATVAVSLLSRYHGYSKPYSGNISDKSKEDERFRRILYALCEWRDTVARAEDESPRFLLSDRAILGLAENGSTSTKSILNSVSEEEDEAFPASDIAQYMTPLPSPSPVLLQNIESLRNLLQDIGKEVTIDLQGCMDSHQLETSHNRKDVLAYFWNLFKSHRNVCTTREVEEHQEDKTSRVHSRCTEQRARRRWKAGDFEASRKRFVQKFSCKGPVYHNCRIYAGDGRLLCYCDRKKLDWYVQRGLAEFMDEDPPAVKLLFEPKGRPEDENNDFYIQSKTNRCVGCGESSHYLRYRVIPSCYRQHFPEHLKSHRSHDIVLLCVDCHEVAHRAAERHKRQVALDYGVPLFARRVVDSGTVGGNGFEAQVVDGAKGGVSPLQLRTAAMALLSHGPVMPKERREQLEAVVRAYYGGRTISQEDIEAALLVGKGPRELRRLRKKRGLAVNKFLKLKEDGVGYEQNAKLEAANHEENAHWKENIDVNVTLEDISGAEANGKPLIGSIESKGTKKASSSNVNAVAEDGMFLPGDTESASMEEFDGDKSVDEALLIGSANEILVMAEDSLYKNLGSFMVEDTENAAAERFGDGEEALHEVLSVGSGIEILGIAEDPLGEGEGFSMTEKTCSKGCLEVFSPSQKSSQRVSLLGHGPHGKKVVEILLQKEGEFGISRFCQRWRAVFVESVKPTHLPLGWDILHSGRREFGEYSVYNPSKKATVADE